MSLEKEAVCFEEETSQLCSFLSHMEDARKEKKEKMCSLFVLEDRDALFLSFRFHV
ncbi:hypothetical protein CEXT_168031, partial [Caerostris extrusa]